MDLPTTERLIADILWRYPNSTVGELNTQFKSEHGEFIRTSHLGFDSILQLLKSMTGKGIVANIGDNRWLSLPDPASRRHRSSTANRSGQGRRQNPSRSRNRTRSRKPSHTSRLETWDPAAASLRENKASVPKPFWLELPELLTAFLPLIKPGCVSLSQTDSEIQLRGSALADVEKCLQRLIGCVTGLADARTTLTVKPHTPAGLKHVVGKAGATINKLRSEFGVQVMTGDSYVKIAGTRQNAEAAAVEVRKILHRWENQTSQVIEFELRFFPKVKADTRSLEVDFPFIDFEFRRKDNVHSRVTVAGDRDEVAVFCSRLELLISNLSAESDEGEDICKRLHISEQSWLKHVIGKGGANLERLKAQHDVAIEIEELPGPAWEVLIEGRPASAGEAYESLGRFLKTVDGPRLKAQEELKKELKSKLREQLEKTPITAVGCSTGNRFSPLDPSTSTDGVDELVEGLLECGLRNFVPEPTIQEIVTVPSRLIPHLIGKGGAKILAFKEAHPGVEVVNPVMGTGSEGRFGLRGSAQHVKAAKEALQHLMKDIRRSKAAHGESDWLWEGPVSGDSSLADDDDEWGPPLFPS